MANDGSLKLLKEAFVTGHIGTSRTEVLLASIASPIGISLFLRWKANFASKKTANTITTTTICHVAVECATVLFPMALTMTELLYPWGVGIMVFEFTLAVIMSIIATDNDIVRETKENITLSSTNYPFLTCYRAGVSSMTFVAILAVDFHVFPRRFAKTETTGVGLMDLGAASFVVSAAIVSQYARRKRRPQCNTNDVKKKGKDSIFAILMRSSPLILIGFIKYIAETRINYQEHVSEYGVHWNFFLTLSIVGILSHSMRLLIDSLGDISLFGPVSKEIVRSVQFVSPVLLLVLYQCALSLFGYQDYIENAPRKCSEDSGRFCLNLLAANREGLMGCLGYLALYGISEEIAAFCIWDYGNNFATTKNLDSISNKEGGPYSIDSKDSQTNNPPAFGMKQRHQAMNTSSMDNESTRNTGQSVAKPSKSNPTYVQQRSALPHEDGMLRQGKRLLLCLVLLVSMDYILPIVLQIPVSRRSTNASFVVWTLVYNLIALLLNWGAFYFFAGKRDQGSVTPPPLLLAVNRNGLLVFLAANLMTGAVNIGMNTLEASHVEGLVVIFLYVCVVASVALFLDKVLNVTFKF